MSQNRKEDQEKIRVTMLSAFTKISSTHTVSVGNEVVKKLIQDNEKSETKIHYILSLISEFINSLKKGEKKEAIKLLSTVSKNLKDNQNFLSRILTVLQSNITDDNSQIFPVISFTYAEIVECSVILKEKSEISKENKTKYELLQGFCIYNMKQEVKANQICGSLCLTSLIETCPMILQPAYMKYIWENIVYFIDKPNFQAKSELLNALISLIFASENLFKAFSTVTLYKILDYLTDSDWFRRKLALNVVYTLIIYCQEEILPLKGHIVEFLKVLKSDKVKEVREVCMQTLKLFNEISEEEASVTEREKFENNNKNDKNEKSDNFPHFNNLTTENDRRDTFTKDEPKRDKSFFKNISAIEMNDLSSDSINVRELPSTKNIINNSTKSPRARINTIMNQNNAVANSIGNSQLSPLGSRIKERKIEKEKDDRRKIRTPDKKMEHTGNSVPQSSSTGINNISSNTLGQYIQRSKPNQMNSINNFVRRSVKKTPKEEDDTLPLNISDIKTDDPVKNKFINVNKLKKDKDEGTPENLVNGINGNNNMNPSSLQKRPVTPTKLNTKQITNTEEDICNSNNLNTNPNRELNGQINRNEDGKFVNSKMVIKRDPNYSIFKTKVNNEFFSNAPKEEQIQIIVAEKKEKLQNETHVEQSEPLMNYVKENPRIEQKQRNKDMPRAIDQHQHENTNLTSNSEESLRKQQDSGISQLSLKIEKDANLKSQAQIQNNNHNNHNHKTQEYIYNSNSNGNQNKLEDVLKQMKFLSDKQIFLIDSIEKIQECSKKENEELKGRIKQLEGQVQHLMEFIKNFEKNENLRPVCFPSDKERETRPKIEKEENLESFGNAQLSNHDYSNNNNNNQIHNTQFSNYAYSSNVVPTASFNTFNYESNTIYKDDFDSFGGNLNPSQSARTLVNNYARKGNSNVWNEILLELKNKKPIQAFRLSLQNEETNMIKLIEKINLTQLNEVDQFTIEEVIKKLLPMMTNGQYLNHILNFLKNLLVTLNFELKQFSYQNIYDCLLYASCNKESFGIKNEEMIDINMLISFINSKKEGYSNMISSFSGNN